MEVEVVVEVVEVRELAWEPEQVRHWAQELLHTQGDCMAQLEVAKSKEDELVDAWVVACCGKWAFVEGLNKV
ncbi:hypothetical protein Taro_033334 [Colocasia esculenta]|uniref:Uncharacterized protein n=1 Tax=Colocasia esculenta TaxID=4460 RepID=A0A843VZW0_COLES|nr:hypothetical protein [Colocasia esculenta]